MTEIIGNYSVKKCIGQGYFGRVYKVEDSTGNFFAAKVMPITKEIFVNQLREAILQMSLQHQYLLRAHQAFIRKK
jgi:hypothetical protein